jgi:hypothetical protein
MTIEVVPLRSEHLEDAPALVHDRYRALRRPADIRRLIT